MNISVGYSGRPFSGVTESRSSAGLSQQKDKKIFVAQDRLTIGRQSLNMLQRNNEKNFILTRLMEQKQQLMERRTDYLTKAIEKGTSPEDIELEMDEMDRQMEELESQIYKIQLEDQRKATGVNGEQSNKEAGNKGALAGEAEEKSREEELHSTKTMNVLLSANSERLKADSVKQAKITLKTESKALERNDPARSDALMEKAERMDGELLRYAGSMNGKIARAVEQDREARAQQRMESVQPGAKEEQSGIPEEGHTDTESSFFAEELRKYTAIRDGKVDENSLAIDLIL